MGGRTDATTVRDALSRMIGNRTYDCGASCCMGGAEGEAEDSVEALDRLEARLVAVEDALLAFVAVAEKDEAENPPGHSNSILSVHRNLFTDARAALAAAADTGQGTTEPPLVPANHT